MNPNIEIQEVHIYANGFASCSVCAPAEMSIEDVTVAVNRQNPSGISNAWALSDDGHFADGKPMPAPCNTDPNRKHYLFHC